MAEEKLLFEFDMLLKFLCEAGPAGVKYHYLTPTGGKVI